MTPPTPRSRLPAAVAAEAPGMLDDASLLASPDALQQANHWAQIRTAIEGQHNSAHGYIGGQHGAFEDPSCFFWFRTFPRDGASGSHSSSRQ